MTARKQGLETKSQPIPSMHLLSTQSVAKIQAVGNEERFKLTRSQTYNG